MKKCCLIYCKFSNITVDVKYMTSTSKYRKNLFIKKLITIIYILKFEKYKGKNRN